MAIGSGFTPSATDTSREIPLSVAGTTSPFDTVLPSTISAPRAVPSKKTALPLWGRCPPKERAKLLNPLILPSVSDAALRGQSLALIRTKRYAILLVRPKSAADIIEKKEAYAKGCGQGSLLDKELESLEPTPYEFKFRFHDADGEHTYTNGRLGKPMRCTTWDCCGGKTVRGSAAVDGSHVQCWSIPARGWHSR